MHQRATPASVAAFLLGSGEPPPPEVLRALRIAAYAYTSLPPGHPLRPELRGDYLASLLRHQEIKREMLPLLRAWHEAGVDVILSRGFHLSEFVYPTPGARFHGDVDVLIRPEQERQALEIARSMDWSEGFDSRRIGQPYYHTAFSLYGRATLLEAHRWAVHCCLPWTRVQRRITAAVWEGSRSRAWEGEPILEMDPVDALLVGVVLQRCWGDRWHLKPHDALDCRVLTERAGVQRERLLERARELGCARTLRLFLERCDTAAGQLDVAPPTGSELRRWDRTAFPERGPLGSAQRGLALLWHLPQKVAGVVRVLPIVLQVRRALRRKPDMHELLRSLTPARARPTGSLRRRFLAVHSVNRALRLLPGTADGDCLVRSLALYVTLRREGWPAVFVSGVRREEGGVVGHAWIELEGRVLHALQEPCNRLLYEVNFSFPQEGARDRDGREDSSARVMEPPVLVSVPRSSPGSAPWSCWPWRRGSGA